MAGAACRNALAVPVIALCALLGTGTPAVASRPNIVLIFVDDLGYNDVSYNGATEIETPNIDRLAREGVVFANGYVVHPTCGPSRAGLMTGRYPARFGMGVNLAYAPSDPDYGLPVEETTLAAHLKRAGYRTGIVGKWQLGAAPPFHPLNRGFDSFYGFLGGTHAYYHLGAVFRTLFRFWRGSPHAAVPFLPLSEGFGTTGFGGYLTDALTDRAVGFIEARGDEPFFLYLAYNAPHTPLQAPSEFVKKYDHVADKDRRVYLAMVDSLDRNVGRVVAALEGAGRRRDTIVFFLSDNGGVWPWRSDLPAWLRWADNAPFREGKISFFEGGIRVPFVVSWPARWPRGAIFEPMVSSLDIAATAMALAGAASDPDRPLDGVNLDPFLAGEKEGVPHEALFWRRSSPTPRFGQFAVRAGDMKLVKPVGGKMQLFDLARDPGETRDLIDDDPETAARLAALWNAWNRKNVNNVYLHANDYRSHPAGSVRAVAETYRARALNRPLLQIGSGP